MRISDWSSDVCSSDLIHGERCEPVGLSQQQLAHQGEVGNQGLARSGRRAEREGRFLSQAIDALELRCPQNAASAAELIARISEQPTLPFRVQISERARSEEHTSELQSLMRN